jgi:hypothetical protein
MLVLGETPECHLWPEMIEDIVLNIVLNPREEINSHGHGKDGVVWLWYPPTMILFCPFHYEFEPFLGLEPGVIPIFPSEVSFNINY